MLVHLGNQGLEKPTVLTGEDSIRMTIKEVEEEAVEATGEDEVGVVDAVAVAVEDAVDGKLSLDLHPRTVLLSLCSPSSYLPYLSRLLAHYAHITTTLSQNAYAPTL
jgi:hypothetical protein